MSLKARYVIKYPSRAVPDRVRLEYSYDRVRPGTIAMLETVAESIEVTPSNTLELEREFYSSVALTKVYPRDGLVGEWLFWEGEGTTLHDSSGYGNHGTIYGMTWQSLPSGKCCGYFDGVDDYVDTGLNAATLKSFTLMAWVKSNVYAKAGTRLIKYILSSLKHYEDNTLVLLWANIGWYFRINVNKVIIDILYSRDLDTEWHHVAGTLDAASGTMKFYFDGVLKMTATRVPEPSFAPATIKIGWYYWWIGLIDEVRIYNRALSQPEIVRLMNMRGL